VPASQSRASSRSGGQVTDPEVVAQGGIDPVGRVDVAVGHPPAQRLGRDVDQLDLIAARTTSSGDGLPLRQPR
jgi:hypothetical protein